MAFPASLLRRLAAFLVPMFLAAGAHAALPAGVTQDSTIEGVTEYRLANGLTVLLFPDASKPTTTVNVTYKVGSGQENYGETGMAPKCFAISASVASGSNLPATVSTALSGW